MPFAALVSQVRPGTPRLLVNRERVGEDAGMRRGPVGPAGPFDFDATDGVTRDGFVQSDCDAAVLRLVQLLGWEAELEAMAGPGHPNWPSCTGNPTHDIENHVDEVIAIDVHVEPPPPLGFVWGSVH